MTKRPYGELRDAVKRLADGTRTAPEIAKRIGCTTSAVWSVTKRYGVRDKVKRIHRDAAARVLA